MRDRVRSLIIRTPEGIVLSLALAGPVTRFLAWLVDVAVVGAAARLLATVLALLNAISSDLAMAVTIFAYFVVQIGYGMMLEWFWRGQTLGKRLLGLRVMDVGGLKLTFSQIVVRNLLRAVDSLPLLYMVGGLTCLINSKAQRLGDLAANTIVVRRPRTRRPNLDQLLTGKFNSLAAYPHLEARLRGRTPPAAAHLAVSALLRREEFDPDARVRLFADLAAYFRSLVALPPEVVEGVSDEQVVRNVVDALYRNGGSS